VKSVPPNSTVVGIPAKVVGARGDHPKLLEHGNLPDPSAQDIAGLRGRVSELEELVRQLLERPEHAAVRD
jgi:serine O-acetyltransferase